MQPEECLPKTVVRIEVDGKIAGTGFFTARDGQVLTCFHVVKDGQTGRLTDKPITVSFEGESYPARCIFTPSNPEQLDMALLRIEPRALPPGALVLPRVAWDGQQHTFYTYGFRSADAFQQGLFATGDILGSTVIANGSRRLQLLSGGIGEEALRQGMSGAPVVIEGSAQIVGMITDRHHTRGVEIIPLALPIQQIQAGCPFSVISPLSIAKTSRNAHVTALHRPIWSLMHRQAMAKLSCCIRLYSSRRAMIGTVSQ